MTKNRSRKNSRQNPIDYDLLKILDINVPFGIPEYPYAAFELGSLIGLEKVLSLRNSRKVISVRKLKNINFILLDTYYDNKELSKLLPSDAFMRGLSYGIAWAFNYKDKDLPRGLSYVRSQELYQQYADQRT